MKPVLLNCAILTGGQGLYSYGPITVQEAREKISSGFESAIGHKATAEVLSTLLETEVPANRIQYKQEIGRQAIVFSLNKRIEEGRILSVQEIEEIGYTFNLLIKEGDLPVVKKVSG
jgi:hypothetical protein